MFVRFELSYMLPIRMPSIIEHAVARQAAVHGNLRPGLIAHQAADVAFRRTPDSPPESAGPC